MVEPGDHDLVARPPLLGERPETSYVAWVIDRANTTPPAVAAEQVRDRSPGGDDHVLRAPLCGGDQPAVGDAGVIVPATASATAVGTWVPPGPSK